ncbi:UNVERIFIED_CONTAM: hypothetical protein HDU68_012189 [Siphonaria sp. JEL0065]|nr:hypothetical protein HDU68_012189 [Siphonaria sp. JEL0065]
MPLYGNILECVGNTPIVKINNLAPEGVTMWVKVESRNPAGSVKDRIAVGMVEDAERKGLLKPGSTIIESTAGNTGIALAMVAATRGYNFVAVLSESSSLERIKILKFLGAKVLLTPKVMPATLRNRVADDLAAQHGWVVCNQSENPANPESHRNTTAVEILRDFEGERLDYFVSGYGTGGTISGTSNVLKKARPGIRVVACEPAKAPMLSKGEWDFHGVPGWVPDFIPPNLDTTCYDQIVSVTDEEAYEACHLLARREGIMCGISSGATFASALKVAKTAKKGTSFLVMLPDTAERYMSTPVFENLTAQSDEVTLVLLLPWSALPRGTHLLQHVERIKIMKFLGAKVVLTAKELKRTGMVKKAEELAKKHGWFQTKQFANLANPAYHCQTTGPEIVNDYVVPNILPFYTPILANCAIGSKKNQLGKQMSSPVDNILALVGNTPIVKINRLAPEGVHLYVKLEAQNPLASVKDRLALGVIEDAERRGLLKKGMTIVEATSGNTGIALAMVCAAKGYNFVAVMIETFSVERRKIMKFLGAKVVLTPKELKGTGMVKKAEELAKEHGWFQTKQFANPANPAYHRQTTGPEIIADFSGKKLDYIVSGWGTGGTLTGVSGFVKSVRPEVKIVACEPAKAPLLAGGQFGPHGIQGWAPDFIPDVLDRTAYDELISVADQDAISVSQLLAKKEGIFVGISSGATFAAALEVARKAPRGSHILAILPDTAERYLSTPLFADISIESDVIEPVAAFVPAITSVVKSDPTSSSKDLLLHILGRVFRASVLGYSIQSALLFLVKLLKVVQGKKNITKALTESLAGVDASRIANFLAIVAFGWKVSFKPVTAVFENEEKQAPSEVLVPKMPIHTNVLSLVGKTPIVKINRLSPEGIDMYVKIESFNPLSSVKDRLALGVIEDAERRGLLKPNQTIVEATSGNTGIALAMVCAVKGYPFVAVMIETFSVERRKIMKFLGAKVVLTPKELKGTGMVKKAEELAKEHGWFQSKQFANPANPEYHRQTTGPEILKSFAGKRLDYVVSGWGTGGTLTGVSAAIKSARPDIKIVAAEPAKAPLLAGGNFGPHGIQGWAPDFIPEVLNRNAYDTLVPVVDENAIATSKLLAQKEGIFVGISSGATFAAALEVAKTAPKGSSILVILPDTAERYLSTPLFADISGDSDIFEPVSHTVPAVFSPIPIETKFKVSEFEQTGGILGIDVQKRED